METFPVIKIKKKQISKSLQYNFYLTVSIFYGGNTIKIFQKKTTWSRSLQSNDSPWEWFKKNSVDFFNFEKKKLIRNYIAASESQPMLVKSYCSETSVEIFFCSGCFPCCPPFLYLLGDFHGLLWCDSIMHGSAPIYTEDLSTKSSSKKISSREPNQVPVNLAIGSHANHFSYATPHVVTPHHN